jgi:uncharacterized protein involved in exopolysaccharide biosynthesis
MDMKKESTETEVFPVSKTRMDRVNLVAYDQDNWGPLNAEPAQLQTGFLRDFLHVVFKCKLQILSFIGMAILFVAIDIYLTTPIYKASAKFLVKVERENIYELSSDSIRPAGDREINSEIEILKSRSLAEKTIKALGPTTIYPNYDIQNQGILQDIIHPFRTFLVKIKNELRGFLRKLFPQKRPTPMPISGRNAEVLAALNSFQDALGVSAILNSNLIRVSFTHEDPQIAAKVVGRLADVYLEHHLKVHKTPSLNKFIKEQTELLKDKLQQSENKLKSFKEQHEIISLSEERSLLLRGEAALFSDLNGNLGQAIDTEKRIQLLREQLASTPKRIPQGENISQNQDLISALERKLVELEIKENELKSKYTVVSNLPELKNVKEERKVVQKKLKEYEKKQHRSQHSGENPTFRRLHEELLHYEAELKALRAKTAVQRTQLSDYKHKLENLNQVEAELVQLQHEIDMNRQNYRLYLSKFEESRISDAMDAKKIASVFLIEPPQPPLYPVASGGTLRNLLLAILIGVVGGLGLALCREYLSDRIEKVEDVEECLQLPVLASIPELKNQI